MYFSRDLSKNSQKFHLNVTFLIDLITLPKSFSYHCFLAHTLKNYLIDTNHAQNLFLNPNIGKFSKDLNFHKNGENLQMKIVLFFLKTFSKNYQRTANGTPPEPSRDETLNPLKNFSAYATIVNAHNSRLNQIDVFLINQSRLNWMPWMPRSSSSGPKCVHCNSLFC